MCTGYKVSWDIAQTGQRLQPLLLLSHQVKYCHHKCTACRGWRFFSSQGFIIDYEKKVFTLLYQWSFFPLQSADSGGWNFPWHRKSKAFVRRSIQYIAPFLLRFIQWVENWGKQGKASRLGCPKIVFSLKFEFWTSLYPSIGWLKSVVYKAIFQCTAHFLLRFIQLVENLGK